MGYYRLYVYDRGGHRRSVVEIIADTDAAALASAKGHADGSPMELWNQDRMVKAFAGEAEARADGSGG